MNEWSGRTRWLRITAAFLALSYGIGGPLTAFLELRGQTLSQRFDYPPAFIYLTCAVQLVCAIGIVGRRSAVWPAVALTVITVGAIASHVRIGSPETAIAALVYTAVQIWYGLQSRRSHPQL